MPYDINYKTLPNYMYNYIQGYIEDGRPIGDFLTAIFSNQLVQSFAHADTNNRQRLDAYATFLFNEAPIGSHGSIEAVLSWQARGGLNGIKKAKEFDDDIQARIDHQSDIDYMDEQEHTAAFTDGMEDTDAEKFNTDMSNRYELTKDVVQENADGCKSGTTQIDELDHGDNEGDILGDTFDDPII